MMSGSALDGSAIDVARAWLSGLVADDHDPTSDTGMWVSTHESLRREVVAGLTPDGEAIGGEFDVTRFDDWQMLVRGFVLALRDLLSPRIRTAIAVDGIGITEIAEPHSPDRVKIVFNDGALDAGSHYIPVGVRVGFALVAVYEPEPGWWTIAGIDLDWYMPDWYADAAKEAT